MTLAINKNDEKTKQNKKRMSHDIRLHPLHSSRAAVVTAGCYL